MDTARLPWGRVPDNLSMRCRITPAATAGLASIRIQESAAPILSAFERDHRFFMGDLVAGKDPVHRFETDLEARGVFEHAGMLGQGGIGMGVELFQKLFLVGGRHRTVTARGFDPDVQGVVAMPFQVPFHRVDMHEEVVRRFFWCGPTQDQIDNPSPKFQAIAVHACRIHITIAPNTLMWCDYLSVYCRNNT